MHSIDYYEDNVKQVYPNARCLDNESDTLYPNVFWIGDGNGNDISDDSDDEYDAWKSAYNKIKNKRDMEANKWFDPCEIVPNEDEPVLVQDKDNKFNVFVFSGYDEGMQYWRENDNKNPRSKPKLWKHIEKPVK